MAPDPLPSIAAFVSSAKLTKPFSLGSIFLKKSGDCTIWLVAPESTIQLHSVFLVSQHNSLHVLSRARSKQAVTFFCAFLRNFFTLFRLRFPSFVLITVHLYVPLLLVEKQPLLIPWVPLLFTLCSAFIAVSLPRLFLTSLAPLRFLFSSINQLLMNSGVRSFSGLLSNAVTRVS